MCFHNFALISDTHGVPATIQQALDEFKRYEVDLIVHCGDIVDPNVIKYFNDYKTEFVLAMEIFADRRLFLQLKALAAIITRYLDLSSGMATASFLRTDM